jgi:hypothetical protein
LRLAEYDLNHPGILLVGACKLECLLARIDRVKPSDATLGFRDHFVGDDDYVLGRKRMWRGLDKHCSETVTGLYIRDLFQRAEGETQKLWAPV